MSRIVRVALGAALLAALQSPPALAQVAPAAEATNWQTVTELNKVDFTGLSADQKKAALDILRAESCTCGCGMKLAECRVNDKNCPVSPGLAKQIVDLVKAGKDHTAIKGEMAKAAAAKPKPAQPAPQQQQQQATLASEVAEIPLAGAPTKGPADAKVTIVEFSDFQCPFCSRATPWVEDMLKAYPNDVRVVFKQYPLSFHKQAKPAAIASLAAARQGKFWEMHDKLFENYRTLSDANYLTWAGELGLDMTKFKADVADPKLAKQVDDDMAHGTKVGVRGTPSFFMNGRRYNGGRSIAASKPVLDALIQGKPIPTAPTQAAAPKQPQQQQATLDEDKKNIPVTGAPAKGPATAKVTIVEFSDFECPFCSRATPWVEQMLKEYPNDVRVVFKQYPLPFHKNAKPAAIASLAAARQGKFWEMHDKLFANFRTLTAANFETWAGELGLDMAKFKADMADAALSEQVDKDMADGKTAGVRGTPTFFMNGRRYNGGRSLAAAKPVLAALIEGKPVPKPAAVQAQAEAKPAEQKATLGAAVTIPTAGAPVKGPADARVTIVEFSDFQCPYCARAIPWVEEVLKAYPNDVKVVFKQFPLSFHKQAKPAAIASLAAGRQGKFWEMHDKLFENYRTLSDANYLTWAGELGLDMTKFKADIADAALAKQVDQDMADGSKVGVRGTPSFYLNGKKYNGGRSLAAIKPLIDAELTTQKAQK